MKSLLTKIYLYRIFSELILLYPLYNVMFAERGNLSTFDISLLLGVWSFIILVIEIPSGALADKFPRRNLLGIAQLIRAVGYSMWVFWPTFEGFLAGLALWGIGRSLTSGAFEALVYDELKAAGEEKRYAKVLGRTESLALFFSLGSTLAAAPVFAWAGYEGVLWGSVAATVIAGIIAFTLPRKPKQQDVEPESYGTILRSAAREVRHNSQLIKLIIFGVFVGMLFRIFDEYASLIIKDATVPTALIPVVSVMIFTPVIIADFYAYKLEKLKQVTFMVLLIIAGLALAVAGVWLGPWGLLAFAAFILLIKVSMTVFNAKVQHAIAGSTRATVTSVNSFGVEASAIVGFFGYGVLTVLTDTSGALVGFGAITTLVGLSYLLFTRGKMLRKQRTS